MKKLTREETKQIAREAFDAAYAADKGKPYAPYSDSASAAREALVNAGIAIGVQACIDALLKHGGNCISVSAYLELWRDRGEL